LRDGATEGLVAQVVADFVARFDPRRDRCWIAERNQRPVGSIFAVKESAEVCKLRLQRLAPRSRLCFEEGTQSAWLHEILSPHVDELVLVGVTQSRGAATVVSSISSGWM
jgi:hypothetical protein